MSEQPDDLSHGWKPDPVIPGQERFWDGSAWTNAVRKPEELPEAQDEQPEPEPDRVVVEPEPEPDEGTAPSSDQIESDPPRNRKVPIWLPFAVGGIGLIIIVIVAVAVFNANRDSSPGDFAALQDCLNNPAPDGLPKEVFQFWEFDEGDDGDEDGYIVRTQDSLGGNFYVDESEFGSTALRIEIHTFASDDEAKQDLGFYKGIVDPRSFTEGQITVTYDLVGPQSAAHWGVDPDDPYADFDPIVRACLPTLGLDS